jgi:hypothetical protein
MEVYMKRFFVFLILAIMIAGTISAQAIREQQTPAPQARNEQGRNTAPQQGYNRDRYNNSVTIEGILKLERGSVAVESAGTVYYVPMLNRYIGFITGLQEGAKVSVEGYEFRNMLQPEKVTIDGKSYDFMAWNQNQGPGYGRHNYQYRNDNRRGHPNSQWNNNRGGRNRNGWGDCWCW